MAEETDDVGKKLDQVDNWLTKFGNILKKHWGKLLLLLFGYCVYWAFTQPLTDTDYQVDSEDEIIQELPADTIIEDTTTYQE